MVEDVWIEDDDSVVKTFMVEYWVNYVDYMKKHHPKLHKKIDEELKSKLEGQTNELV